MYAFNPHLPGKLEVLERVVNLDMSESLSEFSRWTEVPVMDYLW